VSHATQGAPLIGLFVGGRGTRLGGVDKGNLTFDGSKLLGRLLATCGEALPSSPVVLVGQAEAYAEHGLRALSDEPAGIGPLGGLRALLRHAEALGANAALALACDLPHLGAALVRRLATELPEADFVAPRDGTLWHTLVARYGTGALPAVDETMAAGERALQRVVRRLGGRAVELTVSASERAELRDWDTPADVAVSHARKR
jgi:molybdopterin-guanine dinucleotide biosynthesis protein A